MTSVKKNHCLKSGEKMECETVDHSDDPKETDSDEVENVCNYSGGKLLYFEHSYSQNCASLIELNENSKLDSEKMPGVPENFNIQVPVRRSQRQINKSEKDVTPVNAEKANIVQSPVKSKICVEERSKENIDVTENNMPLQSTTEANTNLKNKSPKNESKSTVGNTAVNAKMLHKDEVVQFSSKVIKKTKISDAKVIFEKEQDVDVKRKTSKKEEFNPVENGEYKKKDTSLTPLEARRKRAYSESSKNELYSPSDNVEKEIVKSKRMRNLTKPKSPLLKAKKSEKLNIDSITLKKRKRNMSAPSNKMEAVKHFEKNLDKSNKGRRKKCVSLSEDPVQNEPAKIEIKKCLSIENKGPGSKTPSSSPNTPVKSKIKKAFRRESLRMVINDDEPPLFSQPDVMVKVKSDDVNKKDDKSEAEEKNQGQNNTVDSLNKTPSPLISENFSSVEPVEMKSPDTTSNAETPTKSEIVEEPKSIIEEVIPVPEYSYEKEDFKDADSENSLCIDESVDKIYEGENEENSKSELGENASNSSLISFQQEKDSPSKNENYEKVNNEQLNTYEPQTDQTDVQDPDSDKPIAERKPRRIIKKKEFFEDITSRNSQPAKKSVGKQKAVSDKKLNSDEDSKHGKKVSSCKTDVESEESSEDDPMKLWCICRQPHNDRFMIQCDSCEDWFHGSCVGVSRQQGRKLEKQQKEWNCPNCLSKGTETQKSEQLEEKKLDLEQKKVKTNESKQVMEEKGKINHASSKKEKVKIMKTPAKNQTEKLIQSLTSEIIIPIRPLNFQKINKNTVRSISKGPELLSNNKKGLKKEPVKRKQNCITCETTPAAANSCYCNEKCLEKHAADCIAVLQRGRGSIKSTDFESQRVVVLDRLKGSVIAGDNAPTAGNIVTWLKANPSFMIACSSASTSSKKEATIQKKDDSASTAVKERKESSDESSKATVRFNVRKTLKNILMDRCKNADDIQLPEEDIRKIAVKIEEELHSLFKDNSFKYRAKYRSLMFNIKDPRNQGLFRKILKGNIPPDKLVRMSPEELASMELAKWREQENQHLLDMIKRVQLEQQSGSCLLLKKTHKGEVEIEDDFTSIIDDIPKTSKPYPGEPIEVEKPEPDKEVVKDTTHHHRSHLFDLNCKICTGKILPPPVEDITPKKIRVAHSISVDLSSPAAIDSVEKTVSRIVDGKSPLSSTGDDSLDQEPTSTVSIGSPETSVRFTSEGEMASKVASVWKGFIYMQDVAKFVTSAYKVSGQTEYLHMDVPDTIQVCGRIIPDQVWDYLGKIKQSGNKELIIIRFQAANDEEALTYNSFYSYLSSRKRYGVVSNYSKKIKDFYILPLAATSPVPIVLMPFDGPGLPSPRPHLLLGVIVRHKVKQIGVPPSKKEKCKEDVERLDGSYTPPLETRSYTPPLPAALQTDCSVNITPENEYSPTMDLKSSTSSEESDITLNSIASCPDVKSKDDSEIYEPSYTPPLQILSSDSPKDRDEDKPYDPEQDILNIESGRKDSKSSPKENIDKHVATENLEKHKKILDALTRQVEETDRQVNALRHLISNPDDCDPESDSPNAHLLDINSLTASGMSSFLDIPENLQDILNVVREKSLDKEKLTTNKGDVDMRISSLFSKSFNTSVDKFSSTFQGLNESEKGTYPQEKNLSRGATPPPDDNEEEISPALVRPSDPRIKIRTSFQESPFCSEEPANVSLSNMSVSELVERAEKELAEMEALEKTQTSSQSVSGNQEEVATLNIDKMSSTWNQFKEPPPPGIELTDLTSHESTYSSETVSSTSDNSLPSSYSSPLIQDAQQIPPHFPPPTITSFPHMPPGFSIQTPPPNIKNFPPPNVISTSFPPPPLPIVSKANEVNPINETWTSWNITAQQSKDNTWQNRAPQWDESWKNTAETAAVECSDSSSHYYPPGSHEFHKEQFYRGESSEGRWIRPQRFGRNNWHKRPLRGGRWRGRRFNFNKNQRK